MARRKRSTARSPMRRSSSGPGEMPGSDMNQPITQGLREMPSGQDTSTLTREPAGSSTSSGLMPGETRSGRDTADGEMPGGGMSRM